MKDDNRFLVERRRMAYALLRAINNCELCFSKVQNGFTTEREMKEVKNTITRIQGEVKLLDADIEELLDTKK